jgi:anti-sigma-K factor RskA
MRKSSSSVTTLRSDDGRWSARVVLLADRTGYLHPEAMPKTEAGRDLQLWSITPKGPVSAGVIRGSGAWHEFRAADATTAIAVTEEPRGGSSLPTGTPIVTGAV